MHLRGVVSTDDVDMGVRVMLESFLGTQKYGVQKRLQKVRVQVWVWVSNRFMGIVWCGYRDRLMLCGLR